MLSELDLAERDGKVSLAEWNQFFEEYRQIDGGQARRATERALSSMETAIELHDEMAAHDAEIAALEAGLACDPSTAAADAPPASPRAKLTEAQALDASLNPPTAP